MLAKLKVIAAAVWADIVDTYKRLKIVILAVGAALIYLEWNKISEAITLAQGKKELKTDEKKDQALAATEKSDNDKANALVQEAQQLPSTEKPVDDNWNKK